MNPTNGVGMLFEITSGELFRPDIEVLYLGSCFAFRHQAYFLTAHHCVKNREQSRLFVLSIADGHSSRVSRILTHPRADLSVLMVDSDKPSFIEPFWGCVGNYSLGEDFQAFGFPEDSIGPNQGQPTPRLFKGHYQRFMSHQSHMGYSYEAGELSIACPQGLSGGPLFRPTAPEMLTGLVAEDIEAASVLSSQEISRGRGKEVHEYHRRVIFYGVAVMLDRVSDWLNEHVPQRARPMK